VTDELLMRAVRAGDCAQLGRLFERYHAPLFDFLYRTTGDRAAAEDLVQDVFVRILKYRHTYRDDSCFETWLYRIARNTRADYFRRRKASPGANQDADEPVASEPDPSQQLEQSSQAALLRRALMQLPDDKRELLVLARYRGMRYEQIGALLDIEVGAVKVRVHRAMKQLRELFDQLANEGASSCVAKKPTSASDRR
jgi:RNA polymerase sigma factor (sigma-70 family)